ncbi:MAG: N-acetyltransferase family protein, partial [Solirubrobacteraceae bacterium]
MADGTTVEIRPAGPGDFGAVRDMHKAMSPDNTYMRFFNISRQVAENEARRICRNPDPRQVTLLALAGYQVVGVAGYVVVGPGTGEVAFAVADHMHHKGIATLLLEHLVSYAKSHQITTLTAETLTENKAMLNVFADAGLPVERHYEDGLFKLTFPLPSADTGPTLEAYLTAVSERESRAEAASLQ